jgi:hypothetical protein
LKEIAMKRMKHLIVGLGAMLILTGLSWAQDSLNVTQLGRYDYWNFANDIAKQGAYAYLTDNMNLRIMDVSAPEAPVEIGYCHLPNTSYSVAVNGNYAYVGVGGGDFCIVNVSNPQYPQITGQCALAGGYYVLDVVVNYPFVYAANDNAGLCVVDVSNPTAPMLVDTLNTPGQSAALSLSGSWLYLADGESGLQIFDVSNPAAPTLAGNYPAPNYFHDVAVNGSLAYVLDGYGEWMPAAGLMILDLTNPIHPSLLSSYGAYARSTDIQLSGNYAYVTGPQMHLHVINVSNPLTPQEVCVYGHDGEAVAIQIESPRLYLAGYGLTILDATNPSALVWNSQYFPKLGAHELAVQGSHAYVVNSMRGLDVFDVADAVHPRWKGFCPSPGEPCKVAVAQPYVYLADGTGGMRIINVSDPANPVEAGFFFSAPVSDVGLEYPFAYLACSSGGLEIVTVANPSTPQSVGVVSTAWPYLVAVSGSYAYTVEAPSSTFHGLRIFSLSDPANPVQVGSLFILLESTTPRDIVVEGSYVYVVTVQALYIINVSDPTAPTLTYSSSTWSDYFSLDVEGNLLYLVSPEYLYVLNVSNPASPVPVGHWIYDVNLGVAVVDSIAYVGQVYSLSTFDCSDCMTSLDVALLPLNPPITIPANGGSFSFDASVVRNTAPQAPFVVWARIKYPNGTYTLPTLGPVTINPPVGTTITRRRNQSVPRTWPAGEYTYLGYANTTYAYPAIDSSSFTFTKSATADGGPWVTEASCTGEDFDEFAVGAQRAAPLQPGEFTLTISPNPFNASTVASYKLLVAGYISIKVYDTAGRLVATLAEGRREAGTHEVTFDGANLPSGIYLYRLIAGELATSGKMVLLK